mgnify:CR=1 FL=1
MTENVNVPSGNELSLLQQWFNSQCDGKWEKYHKVSLVSLDNPGWLLNVDLQDTPLETTPFKEKKVKYDSENDWYVVRIENDIFVGAGGKNTLLHLIREFLNFAKFK